MKDTVFERTYNAFILNNEFFMKIIKGFKYLMFYYDESSFFLRSKLFFFSHSHS